MRMELPHLGRHVHAVVSLAHWLVVVTNSCLQHVLVTTEDQCLVFFVHVEQSASHANELGQYLLTVEITPGRQRCVYLLYICLCIYMCVCGWFTVREICAIRDNNPSILLVVSLPSRVAVLVFNGESPSLTSHTRA